MKKLLLFINMMLLIFSIEVLPQSFNVSKEGNIWYFGYGAGLDFNSGSPVPLLDGQLYTLEGCASISDINGDILFYTDGSMVYNKNHTVMPNGSGLSGHNSSSQSAIIVKKPGSSNIYYIFTVDGYTGWDQGLNYSEVDMSLDGGLGDITLNKNISLIQYAGEKVTAVRHDNGSDFWIVSRADYSTEFQSFLLSSNGVDNTPVISNSLSYQGATSGYLRASQDGSKIAVCYAWFADELEVYNFDNQTGVLSNPVASQDMHRFYGIEFSPDGNLLYATSWNHYSANGKVMQYDLNTSPLNAFVLATFGSSVALGAIQLGPDNKLYVAEESATDAIGVINDPNNVGLSCNYSPNSISLGGKNCKAGLPTFYNTIYTSSIISTPGCTDPAADNYDVSATTDDGSCVYNNCNAISGFNYIGTIGSCCYYEYNDTTTWIAANILCVNNGGSLVSINTIQESDSLNLLLGNNNTGGNQHWINLIDGFSTWENGEPLSFTNYDGSYSAVSGDYMFLQNNGFWDNSPNNGSQSNNGIYPLMEICTPATTTPIISNAFISQPIICYGGFATDEMQIEITQTTPTTTYALVIGSYTGTYFLSYISTNQTTTPLLNINGFLPNVDYFVRVVDSTAYYNGNGGIGSGTSTVGIFDEFGPITFSEPAQLVATTSVVASNQCTGDCIAAEDLTISGGTGPFSFTLNGGTPIVLPAGDSTYSFTGLCAGTYDIIVTDANGCSTSPSTTTFVIATISPIVPAGTVSIFNGYNVSCNGSTDGSITAAASGGAGVFTYSIDGTNFQSNTVFSGLSAGTYTITYKDANGCIQTEQLTLNEPPNLSGTANITQNVNCFGTSTGEITFTVDPLNAGVPSYQYSTDNGTSYQSSNIFSNLFGNMNYDVMIEDNNGCQYTSSVFLNEPPALSASASVVDATCYGLSDGIVTINISGGTQNYTINAFGLSLPLSSSSFTTPSGVPAGNYPYSIVDVNNCPFNDVIIVGEPGLISSIDNVTTCGTFTWIDGNTYTSNNNTATYPDTAVNGCDSVVTLNLILTPNITNTVVDTACGEYLFGANFIDTSGIYNDIFTSAGGCDSIVTLELTIFEDSSVTYIPACDSAEWNGVWYYNDTTVTDTGFYTSYAFGGSTVNNTGKEGNIWYFGQYAGIDFNSGTPTPLSNGQLYTSEGCASICDINGYLLFYSDGQTVFDANHGIMPNGSGLFGNNSSSQSAIIVKAPMSSSLYYIFTADGASGITGNGLYYSIVDMSLNGGLGDVLATSKNIVLFNNSDEKVTAVEHQNGIDFWIISRVQSTNTYHSYLLTSTGLNMTPVTTNIGPIYSSTTIGYLKASPSGELLVATNYSASPQVNLFDFDNSTGILSNNQNFNNVPSQPSYGIEFSPDGSLLYISTVDGNPGQVYQYNMLAGSFSDIDNSGLEIGVTAGTGGALQLAPDGKIYHAQGIGPFDNLSYINDPDVIGLGCNYNAGAFSLVTGTYAVFGLPTFFSSIFNTPPSGCDSVATAIIDIKNSSSTYTQVAQCDSFTWALNGQTYYISQIDTIQSTNIDGCQHIDSLDLMIYPEINVSAIITDELCVNYSDGSIILTVSGGLGSFSYNWSGPNSFSEITKDIFNLSPGTYNLTITDLTSLCTKDTSFVVGAGFDMQLTSSYTDVSCYGFNDGTIDINPINLISPIYTWSDTSISLDYRGDMSPGIYYLQIDDNNCFVRDTFLITQPDSLFIISQQTTSVCLGSNSGEISVQTFGGTPGYDYYWSNWSGNNPDNLNLSPGTYYLDIYDANGCLFEETFEILSYQISVSSVVDNIDCFGGSTGSIDLTVSGGFPIYTYLWSDNSINQDIYNLAAGSVTCTINDYLGCESIFSFNLTQEPQLSSIPSVTGVSCYGGSDGSASLLITGGVSAYNIDWYNADENNLEEGYYPYEITDANGCTLNDMVYIPQEDSLILDIIAIDLQCNGDPTGKIDAIVLSGGVYPYTYSWVGPDNFTANQYIINNLYAGLYTLTVSDANSCDVEFQITLSQPTAVSQDIDFEFSNYSTYGISCMNGSDGWINATPSGGFIPYSFDWDGPSGFESTNQNITNLSEGMYYVTITNGLGCEEEFSFPMSDPIDAIGGVVNSLYDYNGYDVSCYGFNDGGIIVEANGGVFPYTYVWDNVQTLNPLPFQEAGMHLLTMYDNNGCEWESFIVLNQPDELIWTIEMFPDTCEREVGAIKIVLEGGILPYNYLWNDGQTTFEANQLIEGEYNIQVIDKNGCQIFDTIQVSNLVAPKMDFAIMSDYEKLYKQLEDPIVFIDMTELTWQNALYWDWDFGDGTYGTDSIAFHSYQEIGEYDVLLKVTTDYNCIDTLVKKVIIEEYDLFIPNAFTPNSSDDNINEEFRPYGFGISEFQMNIYSRWGGLIYSTTNIEDGWNGKFDNSGSEVQLGVYVYYIKTKDVFGALHEYTGEVNLIR